MTGQPPTYFAAVVLKELLDNALDACETAGVAPEIFVDPREGDWGGPIISVTDNAGGIPPETVTSILDFNV